MSTRRTSLADHLPLAHLVAWALLALVLWADLRFGPLSVWRVPISVWITTVVGLGAFGIWLITPKSLSLPSNVLAQRLFLGSHWALLFLAVIAIAVIVWLLNLQTV